LIVTPNSVAEPIDKKGINCAMGEMEELDCEVDEDEA